MKKIKWSLNAGFGDCRKGEFEVDDNATEQEIEVMAREEAFNSIEWGWDYADESEDKANEKHKN